MLDAVLVWIPFLVFASLALFGDRVYPAAIRVAMFPRKLRGKRKYRVQESIPYVRVMSAVGAAIGAIVALGVTVQEISKVVH